MTPDQFQRVRALFEMLRGLPTDEWGLRLQKGCPDDPVVRAEALDLLRISAKPECIANATSTGHAALTPGATADRLIGTKIGPYLIRSVLGQGGMGTVYAADHERTGQGVALKLIRYGLTAPALLRRFEYELQTLARLEHPGIARIYHADTADAGSGPQPYFAMELIRGENLLEYAAARNLTIRQKLELAARIADAIQYAHQQGVIHRDLKPGNVLVTADGQPKILDFGVARATDSDLQSTTLQTDIGQLIGTLPYMSPEQAGGDPDQVDTRSDIYALGVVMYELLTGRLPYLLHQRVIHEVVRIIREEEPTRLSSLIKTLRGDVETIVGKALAKDKQRRYQTASALAADIRRHLNDQPVEARPPSAADQFVKFARRNKALVGGAAATIVALTAGLGISTALYFRAEEQRVLAEQRANETRQVADFQARTLKNIDPAGTGVRLMVDIRERFRKALEDSKLDAGERESRVANLTEELSRVNSTDVAAGLIDQAMLKPAIAAVDAAFSAQPVVHATLYHTLASSYHSLGLYAEAVRLQAEALATRRRCLGEKHPDTISSVGQMGQLMLVQQKFAEAEPFIRAALYHSSTELGELHPESLFNLANLAGLLAEKVELPEAERCYREVLEKRRRALGEEHGDTLTSILNMGNILQIRGQLQDAELFFREAVDKLGRVLGDEHPHTLLAIYQLAVNLQRQGKLQEAARCCHESLTKRRRVLGEQHPDTLMSRELLTVILLRLGDDADWAAFGLARDARDPRFVYQRARMLWSAGDIDRATTAYGEAIRLLEDSSPRHDDDLAQACSDLGYLLTQTRPNDAERLLQRAAGIWENALGRSDPLTVGALRNRANAIIQQGDLLRAKEALRETIDRISLESAPRMYALLLADFAGAVALDYDRDACVHAIDELARLDWGDVAADHPYLVLRLQSVTERLEENRDAPAMRMRSAAARALAELFRAWDRAEPGKGYANRSAEWARRVDEWRISSRPSSAPTASAPSAGAAYGPNRP